MSDLGIGAKLEARFPARIDNLRWHPLSAGIEGNWINGSTHPIRPCCTSDYPVPAPRPPRAGVELELKVRRKQLNRHRDPLREDADHHLRWAWWALNNRRPFQSHVSMHSPRSGANHSRPTCGAQRHPRSLKRLHCRMKHAGVLRQSSHSRRAKEDGRKWDCPYSQPNDSYAIYTYY